MSFRTHLPGNFLPTGIFYIENRVKKSGKYYSKSTSV